MIFCSNFSCIIHSLRLYLVSSKYLCPSAVLNVCFQVIVILKLFMSHSRKLKQLPNH